MCLRHLVVVALVLTLVPWAHAQDSGAKKGGEKQDKSKPTFGEVVVERASCRSPFNLKIWQYADKEGTSVKGDWAWDFEALPRYKPGQTALKVDGKAIIASIAWIKLITEHGEKSLIVTPKQVTSEGKLVIEVTEDDLPDFLVSDVAFQTDKELVDLLMSDESLRFQDDERMYWLYHFPNMGALKQAKFKGVLMRSRIKLAELDGEHGVPTKKYSRSYKVVPYSQVREMYAAGVSRYEKQK